MPRRYYKRRHRRHYKHHIYRPLTNSATYAKAKSSHLLRLVNPASSSSQGGNYTFNIVQSWQQMVEEHASGYTANLYGIDSVEDATTHNRF